MANRFICTAIFTTLLIGCGGSSSEPIEFSVTQPFLPDFEYDTGFLPDGQDAQVRVLAKAGGEFKASAMGDNVDGELVSIPESGELSLSAQMSLEIFANVDLPGIKFNELVHSIDYSIPESVIGFEPFLIEDSAVLDVPLTQEEIATVPLGSVPGGKLRLTIELGNIQLGLKDGCAKATDSLAQFTGTLTTSGNIDLGATIIVDIPGPFGGEKEFGPYSVNVELPALNINLDLGTFASDGSKSDDIGPCMTADGGDGDGDGDGHGDGDGDGDGDEVCGNDIDDDLDGEVDEGCNDSNII